MLTQLIDQSQNFQKSGAVASARKMLGAISDAPMYGLGYGLPIVRVYAQYYNGDCKLFSVPGYGMDAYLTLINLATAKQAVWE